MYPKTSLRYVISEVTKEREHFYRKLKHFDILNHEWKKLENEIKKNKKILNKKVCPICRKSNFTILFKSSVVCPDDHK